MMCVCLLSVAGAGMREGVRVGGCRQPGLPWPRARSQLLLVPTSTPPGASRGHRASRGGLGKPSAASRLPVLTIPLAAFHQNADLLASLAACLDLAV